MSQDVRLDADTTVVAFLNGTWTGSFSHWTVPGVTSLAGATLSISVGFTPVPGTEWTVIERATVEPTGGFAGLLEGARIVLPQGELQIRYSGGDGIPTKLWLLAHEHIGFAA